LRKPQTLEQRFWQKVEKTESCWIWTGYKMKSGFGQISLGKRGDGIEYAHRVAFTLFKEDIPSEWSVIQSCGNKACVNPEHLYAAESKTEHSKSDVKERLMSRLHVDDKSSCWNYTAYKNSHGYGKMGYGPREMGVEYVHRISYEIHFGEIPKGLFVLHQCDNPACANPDHLFLGTQGDNIQDAIDKGRMWFQK
jgi:hypothetical protein